MNDVAEPRRDAGAWKVRYTLKKYDADVDAYRARHGKADGERRFFEDHAPVEVIEREGNLLTTAGVNLLWTKLTGGAGTAFDNANAYLGVGDSSTAAAAGQTDLQASTNKLRKAMDATYPTIATNTITFKSTFATGDANFAWNEWGVFNASSAGTMLNRKVDSLGTKTSAGSWELTVSISIS